MGTGEPNWQPISMLAPIASLSDERGLRDAREHYATLLEARSKPHVLDDATIERTKRVKARAWSGAMSMTSACALAG
jgi:hypothetical protein